MSPIVPPLAEVFATIPDFRSAGGKRHSLQALLLLVCVAITGDAIFTQHAIAATIVAAGNDYLLMVKENQPTLHDEIAILFADADAPFGMAEQTSAHSQRIEQRRLRASTELVSYTDWPGLAQTLCMERRVTDRRRRSPLSASHDDNA